MANLHLVLQNESLSEIKALAFELGKVVEVDVQRVLLVHLHLQHQQSVDREGAVVGDGSHLCLHLFIVVVVGLVVDFIGFQSESKVLRKS